MSTWTGNDIDSQRGKSFLITGGTSGIGLETAKILAKKGANVFIGADNVARGKNALEEIKALNPEGNVHFFPLDLGSQSSVFRFSERIMSETGSLDVLINNAGLAIIPKRLETVDGHELTFAVNYLGHFVLTSQLFPLLMRSRDPRIISVSSLRPKETNIHFEDLEFHSGYDSYKAYGQSKLALLMFALELHHRCRANDIHARSIPVHPGMSHTHIYDRGPAIAGQNFHSVPFIERIFLKGIGQKASRGALPLLFGATSIEARSGIYYGPDGPFELWGNPAEVKVSVKALNMLARTRLWEATEKLTGVRFDIGGVKTIGLH